MNTDTPTDRPKWLVSLDRQIQRSKGSTKRQLQSLRAQQIRRTYPVRSVSNESLNTGYWLQTVRTDASDPLTYFDAQTQADNEDFQQTLNP